MMHKIISWDQELLLWINGGHTPFWDEVMWYVSKPLVWLPVYVLLMYYCIRYYKIRTFYIILFTILLVTICDVVSVHLFKNLFQRLRPTHEPLLEGLVHTVRNYQGGTYGFVSSHATNYFGLAAFFSWILHHNLRYFTLVSLLIAAIISYSRIYLGVHYPGDVICGALLGGMFGILLGMIFCRLDKRIRRKRETAAVSEPA